MADVLTRAELTSRPRLWLLWFSVPVLAVAWWQWGGGFPTDDAYITLHNAEVLLFGTDPNYGVSPLIGTTSPVHLLLVALLGTILPLELALTLVGVAAAVAYLFGLRAIGLRVGLAGLSQVALIVSGLAGMFLYQVVNGMDTTLAMAAVIWMFVLAYDGPSTRLGVLIGLAPFIRPELVFLSAIFGVQFLRDWKFKHVAAGAVAFIPFATWMIADIGSVVPTTIGVKEAFFAQASLPLSEKMRAVTSAHPWALSYLPILVAGLVASGRFRWVIRIFAFVVAAGFLWALPDALYVYVGRYMYPVVAAAMVGVAHLLGSRVWLSGLFIAWACWTIPFAYLYTQASTEPMALRSESLVEWVETHLPPDAVVLVHDAGYIAWKTDFSLVDVVGLKTPSSVEAHEKWTAPSAGADRDKAVGEIAREGEATHAVVLGEGIWWTLAEDLEEAGLSPVRLWGEDNHFYVFEIDS